MKNIFTSTYFRFLVVISFAVVAACSSEKDSKAKQSLANFKNFVDSSYTFLNGWKSITDTTFSERPIDPNDPSKVTVDTTVMTIENKKDMNLLATPFGLHMQSEYKERLKEVEAFEKDMNADMKKDFESAKAKFNEILPQEAL